jgi:hypothetical protein
MSESSWCTFNSRIVTRRLYDVEEYWWCCYAIWRVCFDAKGRKRRLWWLGRASARHLVSSTATAMCAIWSPTLISYSNRYIYPCGFPCYNTCQKRHRSKVDRDDNTVQKLTNLTFIATKRYKYPFASITKPCMYLFKTFSTYTSAFHLFRPCRELVQANAIHVLTKEQDSAFILKMRFL